MVVADVPDEPVNLSIKKRQEDVDGDDIYGDSLDLRQRADAALHDLRLFFQGISRAEHAALSNRVGNDVVALKPEGNATLTSGAQSKAQVCRERHHFTLLTKFRGLVFICTDHNGV